MERLINCPYCEKAFELRYLVRKHLVNVAEVVPCPHCHAEVPNPGHPDEACAPYSACRIIAIREPWLGGWGEHAAAWLRWGLRGAVANAEWTLSALLIAVLSFLSLLGLTLSERAFVAAVLFTPFLVLAVSGVQRMRVRLCDRAPGMLLTLVQIVGLLAAGTLLLFVVLALAGI